jgi:enoyl-CoA hydratase/carnithine racemase
MLVQDRIAFITMHVEPANALGEELKDGLAQALDDAEAAAARVLVLRSSVPGYFAAGADLKLLGAADRAGFERYLDGLRAVIERVAALPQLSIAVIDGYALGGGLELAMACTLRLASARSRLGVPEIKLGLFPGAGGTQRLPRLVGRGAALDLLLTGRSISGEEAARIGLVDLVGGDETLDSQAMRIATSLATGPFDALTATVRCVDAARDLPLAEGMVVERAEILTLFDTADAREGIAAFLGKRPATFS